ncbi:MAG: hypothetical protein PS018_19830 [bacterium]|nr:hypothetical protein [bacterium]
MTPKIKLLHERAAFFRRLAVGAGHRKFAAKMQVLAEEYEREAALVAAEAQSLHAPRDRADVSSANRTITRTGQSQGLARTAAIAASPSD